LGFLRLFVDDRKVAFVDFDCINPSTWGDGLAQRDAERAGAGTQIGDNLTRFQTEAGNDLSGLKSRNPIGLVESLAPFLGGT
jgi:hypothetical protein